MTTSHHHSVIIAEKSIIKLHVQNKQYYSYLSQVHHKLTTHLPNNYCGYMKADNQRTILDLLPWFE